jgi:hypothetical protein
MQMWNWILNWENKKEKRKNGTHTLTKSIIKQTLEASNHNIKRVSK